MLKETARMYGRCAQAAAVGLRRNLLLIPASIVSYLILNYAALWFGGNMAGGLVVGMIEVYLLTLYYSWLSKVYRGQRLEPNDLLEFNTALFSRIMSVLFILFLISMLIEAFVISPDMGWLLICYSLAVTVLLNAVPEVIYLDGADGFNAMSRAVAFIQTHWIEWFLPLVIVVAAIASPWGSASSAFIGILGTQPFLPHLALIKLSFLTCVWLFGLNTSFVGPLSWVLGVTLGSWFMLFRANLYTELESGSRRKRVFMARQR